MCLGVYIIIFISCITLYYIIYIALRGPILPPFYSTPFYPNCCRLQKTHGRGQEGAWGRFATPSKARFARSIPSILSHPIPSYPILFPSVPSWALILTPLVPGHTWPRRGGRSIPHHSHRQSGRQVLKI